MHSGRWVFTNISIEDSNGDTDVGVPLGPTIGRVVLLHCGVSQSQSARWKQTHTQDLDTGRARTRTDVDINGCTVIDDINSVDT